MKNILAPILAGLLAASTAGCANLQLPSWIPSQDVAIISEIQSAVAAACQAEPDAIAIIDLWNSTVGASVGMIASEICAAVGKAPASAKFHRSKFGKIWTPKPVVINGVVVNFD